MVSVPGKDTGIDVTAETVGYSEDGNALCSLLHLCFQTKDRSTSKPWGRGAGQDTVSWIYFASLGFHLHMPEICHHMHHAISPPCSGYIWTLYECAFTITQSRWASRHCCWHFQAPLPILHSKSPWLLVKHLHAFTRVCRGKDLRAHLLGKQSLQVEGKEWAAVAETKAKNTLPNLCLTELLQYRLTVWLGCAASYWLQIGLGMETWEGLCTSEGVCHQIVLANVDCEAGLRLDQV